MGKVQVRAALVDFDSKEMDYKPVPPTEQKEGDRQYALDNLEDVMSSIEKAHREPDNWERNSLKQAFDAFFAGFYGLTVVSTQLAMASPDQRSPHATLQPLDDLDLSALTKLLVKARQTPVKEYL